MSIRLFRAGVLLIVTASAAVAMAADWPHWGGSQGVNAGSETGLPALFGPGMRTRTHLGVDEASTQNVDWVARIGTENYSTPTVSQGRVLIGANDGAIDDPRYEITEGGVLLCLDEKTGALLWRLVLPKLEIDRKLVSEDFDDMDLGVCASATVDGDLVYLVTNRCEVLCLD